MKTNYMNAKQQFFAITLTIVTVISLAWVKPSKAETMSPVVPAPMPEMEIAGVALKFKKQEAEVLTSALLRPSVPADTTKKKKPRHQLITKTSNGSQTYYYPDSTENGTFMADSATKASLAFLSSPEWKKQEEAIRKNAEEIKKHFDSPEWKKQQLDIRVNAESIRKYYNSPEWKQQQQNLIANAEAQRKQFDSPEWKKQQEDIRKNVETATAYYRSPEFKKKVAEARALQNSAEYKQLRDKFDEGVEALKKKKAAEALAKPDN